MATKRPSELTLTETDLTGYVHADRGADGSAKFDLANLNGFMASRAIAPALLTSTGTGRMASIRLTDAAKIGLSDFSIVWNQYVSESAGYGWLALSSSSDGHGNPTTNASNCPILLRSAGGTTPNIRLTFGDSGAVSYDYAIGTAHGGKVVPMALTRSVADGLLRLYVNGKKVLVFSGSGGTLAGGEVADNWLRFGSTYAGSSAATGRNSEHRLLNRVLTDAEILYHAQTGLLPDWTEHTGSEVALTNGTFTQSSGRPLDSFTADGTSGASVIVKSQTSLDARFGVNFAVGSFVSGKYYRFEFFVTRNSGSMPRVTRRDGPGTDTSNEVTVIAAADIVEGWNKVEVLATSGLANDRNISFEWATPDTFDGAISSFRVCPVGSVARPRIQPGAIVHPDDAGNGCDMIILTPTDVTAVGDRPAEIVLPGPVMTADGFVHFDQIITPVGYELVGFAVKQSGVETSTITVKATSSGGTTVATATLSASVTRVAGTIAAPFSAGGVKLHLANSAWNSNTVTPHFTFRRSLSA